MGKYDPGNILRLVWGKFFDQTKAQNEYAIFIEIKGSGGRCYQIASTPNISFIFTEGACTGSSWRELNDHGTLRKNAEFLGKVHIRYSNAPVIIDGNPIEQFDTYEDFWNFISR